MHAYTHTMKGDTELTEYQKRVESIDNVILCVAEAERLINAIGRDLVPESPPTEKPPSKSKKSKRRPRLPGRTYF